MNSKLNVVTSIIYIMCITLFNFATGCKQEAVRVTTYHMERCGQIAFVCVCEKSNGQLSGQSMDKCTKENDTEQKNCRVVVAAVQTNRDEVALIDLKQQQIIDSDVRVPFNTFIQTGRAPSDIEFSPDGKYMLITHAGESYAGVLKVDECFGPFIPEMVPIELGGAQNSITISEKMHKAYITIPKESAIAIIELNNPYTEPIIVAITSDEEEKVEYEEFIEGTVEVSADEQPDSIEDADTRTNSDIYEFDFIEDVPQREEEIEAEEIFGDAQEEVSQEPIPPNLYPMDIAIRETEEQNDSFLIVGCAGEGAIMILSASELETGNIENSLIATLLRGTPVDRVTVAPDGSFIYAIDRNERTIHVVDMASGEEVDTSGGNPLISAGAIQLDGWTTDITIEQLSMEGDENHPTTLNGIFAFAVASDGKMYVIDIKDNNCHSCPSHVIRSSKDIEDSYPYWKDKPALFIENNQYQYTQKPPSDKPVFDKFDLMVNEKPTYGIMFYPFDPWKGVEAGFDIRRALTQEWKIEYEAPLPYTHAIGGNVEDGGVFIDTSIPFCAVGVRGKSENYDGDILVIEDPPEPINEDVDCSAFVNDQNELKYRIIEAYQNQLIIQPLESGAPLPTEQCFPFAVKYHITVSGMWVVVGSVTGFLNDWATDPEGKCTDRLKPCHSWEEEGCTLLTSRAIEGEEFVNPYIKFKILHGTSPTQSATAYRISAVSGFKPLTISVARYPSTIRYLPANGKLYVTDAVSDGLIEIDISNWYISNQFY